MQVGKLGTIILGNHYWETHKVDGKKMYHITMQAACKYILGTNNSNKILKLQNKIVENYCTWDCVRYCCNCEYEWGSNMGGCKVRDILSSKIKGCVVGNMFFNNTDEEYILITPPSDTKKEY